MMAVRLEKNGARNTHTYTTIIIRDYRHDFIEIYNGDSMSSLLLF
jgi:hypothetical protein